MTTPIQEQERALAEVRALEAMVENFDEARLMYEDSSPNLEAQAELENLRSRLTAARARVADSAQAAG